MLQSQRFLAFASRIQTYILLLLIFVFLAYAACSAASVSDEYLSLLLLLERILSWTIYFMTLWLLVLIALVWGENKVFPLSQFLLTLLRFAVAFLLSFLFAVIEHLVKEGIVIGL